LGFSACPSFYPYNDIPITQALRLDICSMVVDFDWANGPFANDPAPVQEHAPYYDSSNNFKSHHDRVAPRANPPVVTPDIWLYEARHSVVLLTMLAMIAPPLSVFLSQGGWGPDTKRTIMYTLLG